MRGAVGESRNQTGEMLMTVRANHRYMGIYSLLLSLFCCFSHFPSFSSPFWVFCSFPHVSSCYLVPTCFPLDSQKFSSGLVTPDICFRVPFSFMGKLQSIHLHIQSVTHSHTQFEAMYRARHCKRY